MILDFGMNKIAKWTWRLSWISVALVIACGLFWFFYPTVVPASLYVGNEMDDSEFRAFKRTALEFGRANTGGSIEVGGDESSYGALTVSCEEFPVIVLSAGPGATTMMVFDDMIAPSSPVRRLVQKLVAQMGQPLHFEPIADENRPNRLDRFVLEYRDRTDLTRVCP